MLSEIILIPRSGARQSPYSMWTFPPLESLPLSNRTRLMKLQERGKTEALAPFFSRFALEKGLERALVSVGGRVPPIHACETCGGYFFTRGPPRALTACSDYLGFPPVP